MREQEIFHWNFELKVHAIGDRILYTVYIFNRNKFYTLLQVGLSINHIIYYGLWPNRVLGCRTDTRMRYAFRACTRVCVCICVCI